MKTIPLLLASLFLASSLHAADPIGINALLAKPADFSGREITVTGHVDRVSASKRMVILIDASEATCSDGCERKTLVVRVPENAALPAMGAALTATGTLESDSDPLLLQASALR